MCDTPQPSILFTASQLERLMRHTPPLRGTPLRDLIFAFWNYFVFLQQITGV